MRVPDCAPAALSLRLFGPFDARLHGAPLARLRSRKGQWLLALLVLRHGRPVERAWLAGMLWPDSPPSQALALMRRESDRPAPRAGHGSGPPALPHRSHALSGPDRRRRWTWWPSTRRSRRAIPPPWNKRWRSTGARCWRGARRSGPSRSGRRGSRRIWGRWRRWPPRRPGRATPAQAERYLRRAVAVDPLRESAQRRLMQALAAGGNYAAAIAGLPGAAPAAAPGAERRAGRRRRRRCSSSSGPRRGGKAARGSPLVARPLRRGST